MERNQLFRLTRLRLAAWYALVMGCILGASGLGVYHVVAHAYRETIDQGLESVANTLHKSIEPVSQQPEHLQQLAKQLSLELCVTQADCLTQTVVIKNQISEAADSVHYYMRLLDRAGRAIALAGTHLEELPVTSPTKHWRYAFGVCPSGNR